MERKEPTLSSGPIVNDQSRTANDQVRTASKGPSPRQRDSHDSSASESGPGFTTVLALLLAFAGLGGSGFLAWKFTEAQKQLAAAQQRIAGLETRLNLNSDQSMQTVEDIEDKLKWADSEIRKLWGVSNDRNKKSIQANSDTIIQLKRSLKASERNARKAEKVTALAKKGLESKIVALQKSVDESATIITQLQKNAPSGEKLSQDIDRIAQQMPGLRGLATRVKTNEEAIAAIDAYRRNMNRDLLQLKQQINSVNP